MTTNIPIRCALRSMHSEVKSWYTLDMVHCRNPSNGHNRSKSKILLYVQAEARGQYGYTCCGQALQLNAMNIQK